MNHRRIRARFSDYLDRKLPPEQRSKVDAHVAECPACAAELHELERTVDLLQRLPDPEPPPYLAQAVMARLVAGEGRPESLAQRLGLRVGPAFAVPAAAALVGMFLFALVDVRVEVTPPGSGTAEIASTEAGETSRVTRVRRGEPAEVAQRLRGAGHPHSALLATHFDRDSEVTLASWSPR